MYTLNLPINSIEEYKISLSDTNEIDLSFDLEKLLNIFKGSNKNDIVTLSYNSLDNTNIVKITIGLYKYDLNLLDNSQIVSSKIPALNFEASYEIDFKTFFNFIGQAEKISDHIEIKTTDNNLILLAYNDTNKIELNLPKDQLISFNSNSIHSSKFSSLYLLNIFKGLKGLFGQVKMFIGNDIPLKIEGSNKASVMVLLAPRIEAE
jgi:hypothetical protein